MMGESFMKCPYCGQEMESRRTLSLRTRLTFCRSAARRHDAPYRERLRTPRLAR